MSSEAIILVAVLVLLYVLYMRKAESFDVYGNHAEGADYVYELSGIPATGEIVNMPVSDAELLARYTWSERDPMGLTVYDHMYEDYTNVFKYADERPFTAPDNYAYRDVDRSDGNAGVYDSKFSVSEGSRKSGYDAFDIAGMVDTDPLYMQFHGQNIVMSQKNY